MEQGQIPPHSLHPCSRHQQRELSRATCTPEGVGRESKGLLEPAREVEQASAPSELPSQPYPFVWLPPSFTWPSP